MTMPDAFDCVAAKRRAQRAIAKALAGKSPEEQVEILQRMAARTPLWRSVMKAAPQKVASHRKRRSTG
jgi:hypothetical protein